ncbi:hypothetical protein L21SP4_02403 [Kiritimatiella glycovorans]|uniref:Uncharacterized protein n=1 Tax=Kiritimatiella glycovorans TaxID=1307763 RepID=A0A0G3EGZ6_9BACT|nr:hypothetical protein L21SP4_02403 [Kiritimatiella glycovorans]
MTRSATSGGALAGDTRTTCCLPAPRASRQAGHRPRCRRIRWITSRSLMRATMRISFWHFGQRSGSASHTFLMSSRQLPLRFAPLLPYGQPVSLRSAGRGDAARLVFGHVDDLNGLACGLFRGALVALAAHLVRIPDFAKATSGKPACRGDLSSVARRAKEDKVAGAEDLEPTEGRQPARMCRSEQHERQLEPDFGIHAGAVDDGAAFRVGMHLFDGKGVADDV